MFLLGRGLVDCTLPPREVVIKPFLFFFVQILNALTDLTVLMWVHQAHVNDEGALLTRAHMCASVVNMLMVHSATILQRPGTAFHRLC